MWVVSSVVLAQISQRKECEFQVEIFMENLLILFHDFSFQTLHAGSYTCNISVYQYFSEYYAFDPRTFSSLTFMDKLKSFVSNEWIQDQSLCYENQGFVELSLMLTRGGLCYTFNYDDEIYDKSAYCSGVFPKVRIQYLKRFDFQSFYRFLVWRKSSRKLLKNTHGQIKKDYDVWSLWRH